MINPSKQSKKSGAKKSDLRVKDMKPTKNPRGGGVGEIDAQKKEAQSPVQMPTV